MSAVAVTVVVAGCGGGGGSTPDTSSSSNGLSLTDSAQASTLPVDGSSTALTEEVFSSAPTQALAESLVQASLAEGAAETPVSSTPEVTSEDVVVAEASVAAADTGAEAAISGRASAAGLTVTSTPCTSLPPLPAIPSDALKVTNFGAIPNDTLPDDAAISRALKALKPGQWLIFPPGKYIQAKSIYLTVPNAVLWGQGASLHATNPDDQTVGLNADGASIYGFTLTAVTDYRRTAARHARISVYRDSTLPGLQSGNVVRRNVITHTASSANGGSGGVLVYRSKDFTIAENTIRRTLADGIHITAASHNGKVMYNTVSETGDDMIGIVSYMGAGWQNKIKTIVGFKTNVLPTYQVHDIYVANNDLGGNYWGRGIGIVGANNITVKNNNIHNVTRAAGILIGQEASYYTFGSKNILVTGNTISKIQTVRAAYVPEADVALQRVLNTTHTTGHGGIEVYAYGNSPADLADPVLRPFITVGNIKIENNNISEVIRDGVRIGVSSGSQLVGQSTIKSNTLRRIQLKGLNNVLPTTAKSFCSGNTKDGAAVTDASCTLSAAAAPVVTGAVLNCSGMLN
ncbi:MAG: hypothetical protein EOP36_04635 [Rubrivivax sp.]|nr:MAG: hypothetical protein EOP36_04635 [Rubrivivax sp.]